LLFSSDISFCILLSRNTIHVSVRFASELHSYVHVDAFYLRGQSCPDVIKKRINRLSRNVRTVIQYRYPPSRL
jgi:hypothetical protein